MFECGFKQVCGSAAEGTRWILKWREMLISTDKQRKIVSPKLSPMSKLSRKPDNNPLNQPKLRTHLTLITIGSKGLKRTPKHNK